MRTKVVPLACAVLVSLTGLTACQKIDRPPRPQGGLGPLVVEMIPSGDGIPLAYGDLVGVTRDATNQYLTVLWFEGPEQGVTAVWVNTGQRRVVASLAIPRR